MTQRKSKHKIIKKQVETIPVGLSAGRFSPYTREVETAGALGLSPGGKPACPASALSEYVNEAKSLFGIKEWRNVELTEKEKIEITQKASKDFGIVGGDISDISSGLYGFIELSDNLHKDSTSHKFPEYGYNSLYYKRKGAQNYSLINTIKNLNIKDHLSPENKALSVPGRITFYEQGLITERDIYDCFEKVVYEQNNIGMTVYNQESGERKTFYSGRFCNQKDIRSRTIENALKEGIGEITDCIMLTLTTHQQEIIPFMPEYSNLTPVQWATLNIGKMVGGFLKRFRRYQEYRGIAWEYVGYVIEFQGNGFPHVHMIFRGHWLGKIKEIAKLWPYCPSEGVDYRDKRKVEKEMIAQGRLKPGHHISGINLVKYVCAYVGKSKDAVDIEKGVHKGYAWMWFCGVRGYNVSPRYRAEKRKQINENSEKVKQIFAIKRPPKIQEVDHVCSKCGLKIMKDSIQIMSHLCVTTKRTGGEYGNNDNATKEGSGCDGKSS